MDDKKNDKPAAETDAGPGGGIKLLAPGGTLLLSGRIAKGLTPKDVQKALLRGGVKVVVS